MTQKIKRLPICFIVLLSIIVILSVQAETTSENTGRPNHEPLLSMDEINHTIETLEKTLSWISKTPLDTLAKELGTTRARVEEKTKGLRDLQSASTGLKKALLNLEKAKQEQQTVQQMIETYRAKGMAKKPPYSLTFYDSLIAEISTLERNKQNTRLALQIVKKNSEDYKEQLSKKESELRQLLEKHKKQSGQIDSAKNLELEIKQILIQQIKTKINAFDIEKKRYEIEINNADINLKRMTEQALYVSSNLYHDISDLNHQLDLIQKKQADIQEEIEKFMTDQKAVEAEWLRAQQQINTADTEQERNIAQTFLKARDEWLRTYIVVIELKQDALRLLERQKTIWQDRYAILKTKLAFEQKKQIHDDVEKNLAGLKQALQIQQNFLINLQKQISAIETLVQEAGTHPDIIDNLDSEKDALKRQFERRLEFQSLIIATDQLEQSLFSQVQKLINQPTIKDKLSGFVRTLKQSWNFEIWVVDQNSVSIGKIFTALVILVIGILLVTFSVRLFHTRLLAASQMKDTAASAVHKGLSYFGYLMVFLLALRIVNIPLTAFAFLGGAVAIGIGFGAQNLINNFISGFIILGERPINIGDLIEVDGLLGKVEEIGARCTRVRTGENVHKLIPNSSFLEKNITNWTLSDNRIRTKITVGVAYGSPAKKVESLLFQAAQSNTRILNTPEPFVLFADFGDNALIFEVYFWIMVRMVLEKKQIESQVRFEIDSLFQQEGIVIAFPQRDIHFDTDKALNIKLIDSKSPQDDSLSMLPKQ